MIILIVIGTNTSPRDNVASSATHPAHTAAMMPECAWIAMRAVLNATMMKPTQAALMSVLHVIVAQN